MTISLSPETQKLLEERMKSGRFSNADELVRAALQTMDEFRGEDYEDLDPRTRSAIEEAEARVGCGEGRPWEEVREEIRARFIKP